MTTKEQIIRLVLDMDDDEAERVWDQIISRDDAINGNGARTIGDDIDAITRREREAIANMPPITEDDPLWSIVGVGRSAEPSDIEHHKDAYLADAFADLHDDDDRP